LSLIGACDEIRMEIGDTDRKFLWKHNLNEISVCESIGRWKEIFCLYLLSPS
jgi:hypothetical protein